MENGEVFRRNTIGIFWTVPYGYHPGVLIVWKKDEKHVLHTFLGSQNISIKNDIEMHHLKM